MDAARFDEVHAFWFGPLGSAEALPLDRLPMWFGATPEIDDAIRDRFGALVDAAAAEPWDVGALTAHQQLGLVVLLDQMTRNTRRGSPLTFQHDARAREISTAVVAMGLDRFTWIERMFAILPLGHSEDLKDQDAALALFEDAILPNVAADNGFWKRAWHQAQHHRETVARFGRFPHRNAVLGRHTTPEEAAFLATEAGS